MSTGYKKDKWVTGYVPLNRFNGVGWDKIYRDRYWKKEHFDAIGGHQNVFIWGMCCFWSTLLIFWFLFSGIRLDLKPEKCCGNKARPTLPRFVQFLNNNKKVRIIPNPTQFWIWFFLLLQRTWRPSWPLSIPRARSQFRKPPTDGSTITRACPASTATAW